MAYLLGDRSDGSFSSASTGVAPLPLPQSGDLSDRSTRRVDVGGPLEHDAIPFEGDFTLKGFRDQLLLLARMQIQPYRSARIDFSGVVRQTLIEAQLEGHVKAVEAIALSPDGRHLASASSDKTALICDLESRTLSRTLSGHEGRLTSVAYSRDGK
jgi:WD40 repeat protein